MEQPKELEQPKQPEQIKIDPSNIEKKIKIKNSNNRIDMSRKVMPSSTRAKN